MIEVIFGHDCVTKDFSHLVRYHEIKGVNQITIPDSVEIIGKNCLSICKSLTQITIPSSVQTVGEGCFFGCKSLTQTTIPPSVQTL